MFRKLRLVAMSTLLATTACGTSDSGGGPGSSDLGSVRDGYGEVGPVIELDTGGLPENVGSEAVVAPSPPPGASVCGAVAHTSSPEHNLSVGIGVGMPSVDRKSSNYRLRFRTTGL
ncbi:MAG: hypothetical protein IV100_06500 [Myxococcales bacterium]|nr:hypothetical protein [Myxococcales bacterium]